MGDILKSMFPYTCGIANKIEELEKAIHCIEHQIYLLNRKESAEKK